MVPFLGAPWAPASCTHGKTWELFVPSLPHWTCMQSVTHTRSPGSSGSRLGAICSITAPLDLQSVTHTRSPGSSGSRLGAVSSITTPLDLQFATHTRSPGSSGSRLEARWRRSKLSGFLSLSCHCFFLPQQGRVTNRGLESRSNCWQSSTQTPVH